ncbi:nucleoside deaminase [Rhodobacteraceae bacterium]|nr:nucleoside deaminase [Paracoccaceae bacterium]MDC1255633.1 nucleoside deaminase [Paracoccaceae bacterium]
MIFNTFMDIAIEEAKKAGTRGEVPIGAVVIDDRGKIISRDGNRTIELNDPTAHAEILVIRKACSILKNQRINNCSLYVTLEPCPMCAAAISNARIAKLYFGPEDKKSGGVLNGPKIFSHKQCHHKPEVFDEIGSSDSKEILKEFFKSKRS